MDNRHRELGKGPNAESPDSEPPTHEEVRQALERVLTAPTFARAWRMGRLLTHLVHNALASEHRELSEFAIGVAVFERTAEDFRTLADPIVRVQVGRLREKLRGYYRDTPNPGRIYILIPRGSYVPEFLRLASALPPGDDLSHRLEISVRCTDADAHGDRFALGLEAELTHCLFQRVGPDVLLINPEMCPPTRRRPAHFHLLGHVRVEAELLRLSARLVRAADGGLLWSAQYDHSVRGSISVEAETARLLCEAVAPRLVTAPRALNGRPLIKPNEESLAWP